jgi:hypothetical protein
VATKGPSGRSAPFRLTRWAAGAGIALLAVRRVARAVFPDLLPSHAWRPEFWRAGAMADAVFDLLLLLLLTTVAMRIYRGRDASPRDLLVDLAAAASLLRIEGNKDPRPLLGANADKLFVVTVNGARLGTAAWSGGPIQPLGRGDFDTRGLVRMLREIGYRGPVAPMCYGIPDETRGRLSRSMRVWKSWFAPAR